MRSTENSNYMRYITTCLLCAAGALMFIIPVPASALNYYLSSDLGVHGLFHLCQYSDGNVYSFNATQLCPLQISDNGPPTAASGSSTGYKAGEYVDGMTKVCVYNVLGTLKSIRIGAVELCPQTYNF